MKKNVLIIIALATLLAGAAFLAAMPAPQQSAAKAPPDFTGVWDDMGPMDLAKSTIPGDQLVLTPYGEQRLKTVDHAKDPSVRCLPFGPTRAICCLVHPNMIIQHKDVVAILTESQREYRLIFTDGRGHPPEIADYPEWYGSSIGKWEGDTLVVDTVGIDDRTWLDNGHEHSDKMKLTERFKMTDPNTIQWEATITDPVFFVKPFTIRRSLKRQIGDRIMSHSCSENEKDSEDMVPTIGGVQ